MKSFNLNPSVSVCDLEDLLTAGTDITITKVGCDLVISSTAASSTGIKYHLKSGDNITVADCFEYCVCDDFIVDAGAQINIDPGGKLVVGGIIMNEGIICNEGTIINS